MKIGSIVECINDNYNGISPNQLALTPVRPIKGEYYTIREFQYENNVPIGVYLEEIQSLYNSTFDCEQGFLISRFREVLPPEAFTIEGILKDLIHE